MNFARTSVASSLFVLTAVSFTVNGCSSSTDDEAGASKDELLGRPALALPSSVDVCWENPGNDDMERELTRVAIRDSWEAVTGTNIHFTGWARAAVAAVVSAFVSRMRARA